SPNTVLVNTPAAVAARYDAYRRNPRAATARYNRAEPTVSLPIHAATPKRRSLVRAADAPPRVFRPVLRSGEHPARPYGRNRRVHDARRRPANAETDATVFNKRHARGVRAQKTRTP